MDDNDVDIFDYLVETIIPNNTKNNETETFLPTPDNWRSVFLNETMDLISEFSTVNSTTEEEDDEESVSEKPHGTLIIDVLCVATVVFLIILFFLSIYHCLGGISFPACFRSDRENPMYPLRPDDSDLDEDDDDPFYGEDPDLDFD